MLDFLDDMLAELLGTVPGLVKDRVGFTPPDSSWRDQIVANSPAELLNVYLVELRENRMLRSNQRLRAPVANGFRDTAAPPRLDCHYLVSAWSPVVVTSTIDPTIDEQVLLYRATQVLMDNSPLDANAVYGPTGRPGNFPPELLDPLPPTAVAPPDGFAKLPDFWMRMDYPWKPVVELVVTVPVVSTPRLAGPPVTTVAARYLQRGDPATTEERVTIGGVVRDNNAPVAGAWVRLVELDRTTTTDTAGRFVLGDLARGAYTLEAVAVGHGPVSASVQVPSDSGGYNLLLPISP
jgi:hypothetical protein